jgi:hypothetical protein
MKPNFALSLSFEGIQLLLRQNDGWARVGEVDLTTTDLSGDLSVLRETALSMGRGALETKLIIPDEQIKYLQVETGTLAPDALQDAVMRALDGATPYSIDELAFDFANSTGLVHVAAVARETLVEAETFAVDHGFSPIGFVAAPSADLFPSEPNFGATQFAQDRGIGAMESDPAVVIATMDAVALSPEAPAVPATPDPIAAEPEIAEPVLEMATATDPTAYSAQSEIAFAESAPQIPDIPPMAPVPEVPGFSSRRTSTPAAADQPHTNAFSPQPAEPVAPVEPPHFEAPAIEPAEQDQTPAAPRLTGVQRASEPLPPSFSDVLAAQRDEPEIETATPPITGRAATAAPQGDDFEASVNALRPGAAGETLGFEDIPPLPRTNFIAPSATANHAPRPTAGMVTSRVEAKYPNTEPLGTGTAPVENSAESNKPASTGKGVWSILALAATGLFGALRIATSRTAKLFEKRAVQTTATATGLAAPAEDLQPAAPEPETSEEQRMTLFGLRKPKAAETPVQVGGKPRFLGLILTTVLLLFLVSVAAWASVYLDEGLARIFRSSEPATVITRLPAPEQVIDEQQENPFTTSANTPSFAPAPVLPDVPGIQLAALDDGLADIDAETLPLADDGLTQVVEPPAAMSPEEVAAKYAATGIWQATPTQPGTPDAIALEDVYVPSIDAPISGQDAFALLRPDARSDILPSGDAPPPSQSAAVAPAQNAAPINPTPNGALTPEGALVFSGRPAVVPPSVPERLLQPVAPAPGAQDAPDSEIAEVPASLGGVVVALRPQTRPSALVENTERLQLGGNTREELAALRPRLRPAAIKQAEEIAAEQAPATAQAIALSRKPNSRPRNFDRTVARAQQARTQQAARQKQAQPEATQVAAVAPRTVTPRIPSSTSVAKAATVKNAINLSRVNLIGVYGKPSSRRALVRLSNGRYKKVKIGDRVDGGRVSAIGEAQLNYTKNGRSVTLKMPKG